MSRPCLGLWGWLCSWPGDETPSHCPCPEHQRTVTITWSAYGEKVGIEHCAHRVKVAHPISSWAGTGVWWRKEAHLKIPPPLVGLTVLCTSPLGLRVRLGVCEGDNDNSFPAVRHQRRSGKITDCTYHCVAL
ncbi:hypothetical protein EXIGLDRAFT_443188 [Exidia glandulosa HHB12029]|uniref:Uncharacterized protein n=1 Tax=Exidia glandulosa HHB12029 TaxID=1314781 RepID=A0A165B6L1_EXIGL|nr:hypothetical protein EXIGLDRAFT_443188 [Exidia glandulosa HHB12029]